MTVPVPAPALVPPPAPDDYVLPARLTRHHVDRGPRFSEDVWDLRAFLPRTHMRRWVDFRVIKDQSQRRTAKEYIYSRLRRPSGRFHRPMKLTRACAEAEALARIFRDLRTVGASCLKEVEREHLDAVLPLWKVSGASAATNLVGVLKHLAAHGPFLSHDRLGLVPWVHRSARHVGGLPTPKENTTPRIPEEILAPMLAAALFYVQVASGDILAALRELDRLEADRTGRRRGLSVKQALDAYLAERRAVGCGLPAVPRTQAHRVPWAKVRDHVVQAPNIQLLELLIGTSSLYRYREHIIAAGEELGWEEGGIPVAMSPWPASGKPWCAGLSPTTLSFEVSFLRTACWLVIAYLSGMRDDEVRLLPRECAVTDTGADGRTRYKIWGRVYKGRKLTGDEAEWTVLPVVHEAVNVLRQINDDPRHLFGHYRGEATGYAMTSAMPQRLDAFRDHLNDLFSTRDGLYVPLPVTGAATSPDLLEDDAEADDAELGQATAADETATRGDEESQDLPWRFDTRQFRRTLAWHIAHQPFGVVAGTRQYKHTAYTIFEGYAGTSQSGFADEVATEKAVAKLDYVEDLYHDWNEGGKSAGGAAGRIDAEFDRIRAELGDLPGTVASPERLRSALHHLTRTLHPGVLNDCFHHAPTAVCGKRAKAVGRPLPMLNMCLSCPNSRRSAVHLPRIRSTRDLAVEEFADTAGMPRLQQAAMGEFVATLDDLITELTDEEETTA